MVSHDIKKLITLIDGNNLVVVDNTLRLTIVISLPFTRLS